MIVWTDLKVGDFVKVTGTTPGYGIVEFKSRYKRKVLVKIFGEEKNVWCNAEWLKMASEQEAILAALMQ